MKRHQEAIDALRRARAVRSCDWTYVGCPFHFEGPALSHMGLYCDDYPQCPDPVLHARAASALLDGFDVADVTAAEEALDG